MNNNTPSQLSRRNILRSGGAIVASGAVLAACGGGQHSGTIARIGSVPEIEKLETEHVTDVALLRTAM